MLKGVNKKVVEVIDPDNEFFERAILFIKNEEQQKDERLLRQKAADYLIGEHDFKSFCTPRTQVRSTVRTIYDLTLTKEGDEIRMRITGNGFLYNMVRIIAGTLARVGTGLYTPERVKEILEAKDRNVSGPKAPPQGLTLISIAYPAEEKE